MPDGSMRTGGRLSQPSPKGHQLYYPDVYDDEALGWMLGGCHSVGRL